jgi:tight adherence protein C
MQPASASLLAASVGVLAASSALVGGATALVVWWVVRALTTHDLQQGSEWRYDINRINELRRTDVLYRLFQPLIVLLARVNRAAFAEGLPTIARQLLAAGLPRLWLPEEYLARMQVIALLLAPLYIVLLMQWLGGAGLWVALLLVLATVWLLRRRLAVAARKRLTLIKRRLPFLLDLLTLLMEAGSTFLQALRRGVQELGDHPVAVEFGRVLADINVGKTRREAFTGLRERLNDDEITSIVSAIVQGEELGTPLARIFRTQADVLRLKRSQRAEAIAGEAGVKMLMPAVVVMASTVLIIFGPFILNWIYSGLW